MARKPSVLVSFSHKKSGLHRHIALHTGKKPYICVRCEKPFGQKTDVRGHMRAHTVAHESSHCGGTPHMFLLCDFSFKPSLNNRVRIRHHGRKFSGCSQCEKPFPALKKHMLRGHTGRNHNEVLFVRRHLLLVTNCKSISKFMAERIL